MISINNPILSTLIFEAILLIVLVFYIRKKTDKQFFPISQSQELKGLAILLIVFSHIGYFLVTDNRFLFPISIMAGVGVDIFLFLSGLGLCASAFKNKLPILDFYKKNFLKLFVPLWIVLISFFTLDFFVLKITYSWQFITKAFLGIFTTADLYLDVNSPLWYFTLIIFYYLLFPIVFSKKRPWLSAIIIYAISYLILQQNFGAISKVAFFYNLHIIAFPLGILGAWIFYDLPTKTTWLKNISNWFVSSRIMRLGRYASIVALTIFICYFSYYFGGQEDISKARLVSIFIMLAIIFLFLLKKIEFKLLSLFGIYSYEIYLLHWPIFYRYDIFYKYTPAWLATVLYLIFFIVIAWIFKKLCGFILRLSGKKNT